MYDYQTLTGQCLDATEEARYSSVIVKGNEASQGAISRFIKRRNSL